MMAFFSLKMASQKIDALFSRSTCTLLARPLAERVRALQQRGATRRIAALS
eukprot:COSAG06_NODE_20249_length_802_cov_18.246088_2_plen_50_part_01